jgi:hypothetical protein
MPAIRRFASSEDLVAAATTMRLGHDGSRTTGEEVALGAPIPGAEVRIDGAFDGPFCVFSMRGPWHNDTGEAVIVREIGIFDGSGHLLHRTATGDGHLAENVVQTSHPLEVKSFGICRTERCDDTCRCPARLGGRPPCVPACKRLQPEKVRSELGTCAGCSPQTSPQRPVVARARPRSECVATADADPA